MSVTLAIDPGEHTGWAYFGGVVLWACGKTSGDSPRFSEGTGFAGRVLPGVTDAIIEIPRWYDDGVNPNSLIKLAVRAGIARGIAEAYAGSVRVRTVHPQEWKGSVPKHIHNGRVLGKLTPAESVLAQGASHDTIDAIGLGLFAVGRMGRGA